MNKLQISVKKTIYNLDYGKELYILYLRRPLTKKITHTLTIGVCKSLSHVQLYTTPWTASRLLCHWGFPGKNTGMGCHFLLQGIFLTQGQKPCLLHWQADCLPVNHLGSPEKQLIFIKCFIELPVKLAMPNNFCLGRLLIAKVLQQVQAYLRSLFTLV